MGQGSLSARVQILHLLGNQGSPGGSFQAFQKTQWQRGSWGQVTAQRPQTPLKTRRDSVGGTERRHGGIRGSRGRGRGRARVPGSHGRCAGPGHNTPWVLSTELLGLDSPLTCRFSSSC